LKREENLVSSIVAISFDDMNFERFIMKSRR